MQAWRAARERENAGVLTIMRVVHLLSATVWVGGTIALVFVGVPAIRQLEGEARATALRTLGRRWRPLGWGAMGVAILSGLWLTDEHGGFDRDALDTDFDRTLIVKSALVVAARASARCSTTSSSGRVCSASCATVHPQAPATRRRLVVVGWLTFALTLAVPVLGVIALSYLD